MKTTSLFNFILLMSSVLMLNSCLSDETKKQIKDAKQTVNNASTYMKNIEEVEENFNKLKDETPLTNEQLKKWLPESLDGMKRTAFKVGAAGFMNIASIEGTYKTEDPANAKELSRNELNALRKKITVTVIDGAGPTGSMGIAGAKMATAMEMEEDTEREHKKTVDFDGARAFQSYKKKYNNSSVMFIYKDRFGVTVNATNMNVDETWDIVKKLDLNQLTKLAK